jgi:iron complex transport system permease protein
VSASARIPAPAAIAFCTVVFAAVLIVAPRISHPSVTLPIETVLRYNGPRAVLSAILGAALAAAGVVLQAVLRNPLATPYTLGISSGAALGAAAMIKLGTPLALATLAVGLPSQELAALAGALASAALVYAIARSREDLPAETLLLAGVAVALLSASGIALLQFVADTPDLVAIVHWSMGGVGSITWPTVVRALPLVFVGAAILTFVVRDLDVASLDEESARALGVDPVRTRKLAFAGASLLTAAVVSVAGPIGFVGLIVPHAVRGVLGPDHRVVLPCSILLGGAFLVACDTAARTVLYPTEVPINIVTSAIGCPVFIWILARGK